MTIEHITPEGLVAYANDRRVIDSLIDALRAADSTIMWEMYRTNGNPDAEIQTLLCSLKDVLEMNEELK